jgi:hypothetical protein
MIWIDAGIYGEIWELPAYAGMLAVVQLVVLAVAG